MRSEEEIKEYLMFVKHKVWQNGSDVYKYEIIQDTLNWILNKKEGKNEQI